MHIMFFFLVNNRASMHNVPIFKFTVDFKIFYTIIMCFKYCMHAIYIINQELIGGQYSPLSCLLLVLNRLCPEGKLSDSLIN